MLCCCTSCATSCCGSCCKAVGGGAGRLAPSAGYSTRIPYLLFMFLGIVVAMTLREWGTETLFDLYVFDVQACTEASCLGNQVGVIIVFMLISMVGCSSYVVCHDAVLLNDDRVNDFSVHFRITSHLLGRKVSILYRPDCDLVHSPR